MGYTHYWTESKIATESAWEKYRKLAMQVINEFDGVICDGHGEGSPIINSDCIILNGDSKENENHETFRIDFNIGEWNFCKTARKPYDDVVVALLILAQKLGIIESWNSDGSGEDFILGNDLLISALLKE